MRTHQSPLASRTRTNIRRDGWTPERQLRFLDMLSRTRNVTESAAFAGMSRESAHRLRGRPDGALFAALWDRIFQPDAAGSLESHSHPLTDARLARLLGTHFRRERRDFSAIGSMAAKSPHK
jgi:hypothetical protein